MKQILLLVILTSAIFFGCDESGTTVFTVQQEDFESDATGVMEVLVDQSGAPLKFTGTLNLIDGECSVSLYTPVLDTVYVPDTTWMLDLAVLPDSVFVIDSIFIADTIYNRNLVFADIYSAPVKIDFDKEFDRIIGDWIFNYEIQGIDDVDPFGSFEFTITYNN